MIILSHTALDLQPIAIVFHSHNFRSRVAESRSFPKSFEDDDCQFRMISEFMVLHRSHRSLPMSSVKSWRQPGYPAHLELLGAPNQRRNWSCPGSLFCSFTPRNPCPVTGLQHERLAVVATYLAQNACECQFKRFTVIVLLNRFTWDRILEIGQTTSGTNGRSVSSQPWLTQSYWQLPVTRRRCQISAIISQQTRSWSTVKAASSYVAFPAI